MMEPTSSSSDPNSCERLDEIQLAWHEVPFRMKLFSRAMLKLGYELNVSTTSNETSLVEFKQLRDDTRRDSQIYCKQILPVAEKVIKNMSDYFDNYSVLNYAEWKEELKSIHEEVVEYKLICDVLIQLHEGLMTGLKARLAKANVNFKEMEQLNSKYKQQMEELQSDATRLRDEGSRHRMIGAIIGAFTLGIGSMVGNALGDSKDYEANKAVVSATAKGQQVKIIAEASDLCCHVLIPALTSFIEELEAVSAFFAVTEQNLAKIADNSVDENASLRYYKKTKMVGEKINQDCSVFAMVLPAIRSDLAAIPEHSSDANYVDAWRRDTLEELQKNYEKETKEYGLIFNKVIKSITKKMQEHAL